MYPQTGIQFASGASGFVKSDRITGNFFGSDQRKSAGVLLTERRPKQPGPTGSRGDRKHHHRQRLRRLQRQCRQHRPDGRSRDCDRQLLGTERPGGRPEQPVDGVEGYSERDTTPAATVTVSAA